MPPTKSAFPVPRCAVYLVSCARAKTCAPSLVMRCAPNLRGILMAVRGCLARSRCYRGTSTLASASRVTRVRTNFSFALWLLSYGFFFCVSYGKGAGTVYFTSIRRERGGPFTTCAYQISLALPPPNPLEPNALISPLCSVRAPNLFCTVRFKVITDDGTVILIPCETSPVDVEARAR